MFLFLSALACLVALAFVLVPLLRSAPEARRIRHRLEALDALKEDLPAAEWSRRHDALQRELAAMPRSNDHRLTAALVVVLVPVLVVLVYRVAGTPEALDPMDPRATEVREVLGDLAAAVDENPEDVEAWTRMGLIWKNLQQWPAADAAWRRVLFLEPDNSFAHVELAETLLFASGRPEMPPEAAALLDRAVELDPTNQKALWLSGMGAFQQGRFREALVDWERLDTLLPAGGVKDQVNEQMARARAALASDAHASAGVAVQAPAAGAADRPSPATPRDDAGAGVSLTVTVDLAPELAGAVSGDETVFVFARAASGPPMPLAVQRFPAAALPRTVTLTDADAMAPNMNLSSFDTWNVTARISASGNATASPGDLQGVREAVTVEDGDIALRINERVR
ncbi:c-type cytochrome biogenesis protein CcmI/CycH [Halomonas denitrificans]|nr:hypothetical protein [Halomonas denitrificans]